MTRDEFSVLAREMADSFADHQYDLMMRAFGALTSDEVSKHADDRKPYLLVRAIGSAVGLRAIKDSFVVEASKPITMAVSRILNRRYW